MIILDFSSKYSGIQVGYSKLWGCHGRDRMIVGFTTTCAISAYHYWSCEFEPCHGEVYSIQHYVIKFIYYLRQFVGFLQLLRFPPPINRSPWYNWNIVEIGVKHLYPNPKYSSSWFGYSKLKATVDKLKFYCKISKEIFFFSLCRFFSSFG